MANTLTELANPTRFLAWSSRLLPVLAVITVGLIGWGLWMVWHSPADYQQGETVRIMYIHVPAAWLSTFVYGLMAVSAIGTLVWRHPLADVSARAAAPLGAAFTFLALITGSLWGRPTWGTYWQWDARMTSVLILFIMYLGLIALWRTIEDPTRAARATAVLILVGTVNPPIIKFAVDCFQSLHQPASVMRLGKPTIDPSMLWPLLIMALGYTFLFLTLHMQAMRTEILRRRVRSLQLIAARVTA